MKSGLIWRYVGKGSMPPSQLRVCDATLMPVNGDLCLKGADGEFEYAPSLGAAATAAARTIHALCAHGNTDGRIWNPGRRLEDGRYVNTVGGRGSRAMTVAPSNQRMLIPVLPGLEWVMERTADTAVVTGETYGYDRTAAANYRLDPSDTQDCLIVVSFFESDINQYGPDVADGGTHRHRVWVKAFLPGGDLI